jgi:hypothetical protein
VPRESGRRAFTPTGFGKAAQPVSWFDTDVICQPAKKKAVAWLEAEQDRCYTSAVVTAQLAYWVRTKEGRQRQNLQTWLTRLVDARHGRIHGFNVHRVWAPVPHYSSRAGLRPPGASRSVISPESRARYPA